MATVNENSSINEEALLALSQISGTELDYEISDSLLETENDSRHFTQVKNDTSANTSVCAEIPKPKTFPDFRPSSLTVHQQSVKGLDDQSNKPDFLINDNDYRQTACDVLDLQRMADKFAAAYETSNTVYEKIFYESGGLDCAMVVRVDKLLEETYSILSHYRDKLGREYRARLLNLLLSLKELPNLYKHKNRLQAKFSRVTEWLNKNTCHPEAELVGFTSHDPFEPRKFIPDTVPRVSCSDTNLVRSKRKRSHDDTGSDVSAVYCSSSDTRLCVSADQSDMRFRKRRRAVDS